jgi:Ca2+-binding EF-hand superfamily protein
MHAQANGSGVSYRTFERAVHVACASATPQTQPPSQDMLKLAFDVYDRSGDGLLDITEVITLYNTV